MKALALAVGVCLVLLATAQVPAVNPDEVLSDAALEARARDISQQLRCLVCQNQSIDNSDADLAHDLRLLVRQRLTAGDTNDQAIQFVVDRYGEFVLLQPRFAWHTLVLWSAAPLVLMAGLTAILFYARRFKTVEAPEELSEDEKRALAQLAEPDT